MFMRRYLILKVEQWIQISDTYSSYRMRRVELWDSWQEDVYTPLTRLSIVEYLKEIYCQFKHNLVKRDLISKVVHDIILPMEFIRMGLLHFYNQ